jgi:hypothetical protein
MSRNMHRWCDKYFICLSNLSIVRVHNEGLLFQKSIVRTKFDIYILMNTCCILPCYSSCKERWLYTQLENIILFLMLNILYSSLHFWECDICFIYFYSYYLRSNCIVLTSWRCHNIVLIGNGELVQRVFETVKSLIDVGNSSNTRQF